MFCGRVTFSDMLIDKHYYAIASKATLLKPDKLPVPEVTWEDIVAFCAFHHQAAYVLTAREGPSTLPLGVCTNVVIEGAWRERWSSHRAANDRDARGRAFCENIRIELV